MGEDKDKAEAENQKDGLSYHLNRVKKEIPIGKKWRTWNTVYSDCIFS